MVCGVDGWIDGLIGGWVDKNIGICIEEVRT